MRHFPCVVMVWVTCSLVSSARGVEPISFNRDIRPILSDTCFQCHGPDSAQRKGGLRLDQREMAIQPAESGEVALVPGNPQASELIRRIQSTDQDLHMPPGDSGKSLSPRQVELLTRWVSEGAAYEGHWAFVPVKRPVVPELPETLRSWAHNPIDHFIGERFSREGLVPAPEASKARLIRRVSLDLLGLPPTLAEVEAFLADPSPTAYEALVDRLLASPHYGERMALQWLDYARYADSNGFQVDSSRQQWPWRDWVIRSFNTNVPFDQFTIEQLAGDLLPNATRDQQIATGFNRNHKLNGEGGIIAEEWRVETVIDRVETTGLTWLGLTLNCCRCHDHKYDPITQREFYQLFALFNNVAESGTLQGESKNTDPVLPVPSSDQERELARRAEAVQAATATLAQAESRIAELVTAWEPEFKKQLATQAETWLPLEPASVKSVGGATLARQSDATYLASGTNPDHDTYEIAAPVSAGTITGILLECFPDPSLPEQSLGRYPNGNFVLTKVEASLAAPSLATPVTVKIGKVDADYSQKDWNIDLVLAGNPAKGWAVDGPTKKEPRRAMFLFETSLMAPADSMLTIRLHHTAISRHNIGRFRLSTTSQPAGAVTLQGVQYPESLKQAVAIEAARRSPEQMREIEQYFRANVDSPVKRAATELAAAQKERADFENRLPTVMVMKELDKPREAFFLIRGQYDRRGEPVTAGLPAVFPSLPEGAPLNRLGFARWLVDPSHPLTARVWVNRIWEKFFGVGLVKTTENLGSQAEYPTHPQLLDWLAAEFMDPTSLPAVGGTPPSKWDMKALQKALVMSAAYRQSASSPTRERDPENRFYSRGPRFRLPGELVRDQALAVSGLLVPTIGGPSVRPYMPDGVWDETSRYGDLRNYQHDRGDGLYRRTLYTIWKRTAAPPTMLLFDAPNREICTVKRSRTNTPLQALALLNEITYVEAARKLGERMARDENARTPAEKLRIGFRLATARIPTAEELGVLVGGWEADLGRFRQQPDAAQQLTRFGESPVPAGQDLAELAAYTLAANILLNLDEVVTRE